MFFRNAEHLDLDDSPRRSDCMARVELGKDSLPERISASEFLRTYAGCRIDLRAHVVKQTMQNINTKGTKAHAGKQRRPNVAIATLPNDLNLHFFS
jgi:hypothetical protein